MQDFNAKRNALFACLDDAASKELKGTALEQSVMDEGTKCALSCTRTDYDRLLHPKMKHGRIRRLRTAESIFRRPEMPLMRCLQPRREPDPQINPHKWTKHSLSDVDISDQTNTNAALAFLKELAEQREQETQPQSSLALVTEAKEDTVDSKEDTVEAKEDTVEANATIEFQQSSKMRQSCMAREATELPDAELDKPRLRGSKLVMPEYVIGQSKNRKKSTQVAVKHPNASDVAGSVTLSHLSEENQADEEDNPN